MTIVALLSEEQVRAIFREEMRAALRELSTSRPEPAAPVLLTLAETAKALRRSRATVHRMICVGTIRVTRVGSRPLVRREEIDRLIEGDG